MANSASAQPHPIMLRLETPPEPIARFRVMPVSRPEAAIEFSLTEPIFVLDGAILQSGQSTPFSQNGPSLSPGQILVVKNPDAWRLKVLAGPPAEKEGIASFDWLLDSQLILEWAGFRLQLVEWIDPGMNGTSEERSGLFRMASSLAATQLQLEESRIILEERQNRMARQKESLSQAMAKKMASLKKRSRRVRGEWVALERKQSEWEESKRALETQKASLEQKQKELEKATDRLVALRTRAVARWRSHIESTIALLQQSKQELEAQARDQAELKGKLLPLMERLARERERLNGVEKRLTEEKAQWLGAVEAWKRDDLARQGQWLQRQAELTQKENQIRLEGTQLLQLRERVQVLLAQATGNRDISWETILGEPLVREKEIAERLNALDSWTKRLETWAGALGEREIQCAKREQDLASIVAEYQDLRGKREAELDRQAWELNQQELALLQRLEGQMRTESPSGGPEAQTGALEAMAPASIPLEGSLVLGPKAKDLALRESDLLLREVEVASNEMRTLARARKLSEESLILEKYRARLVEDQVDSTQARREIALMRKQLRDRLAEQRQNLDALRDYLGRLGGKLRRWGKQLALREANIVEAELRLLEERTHETVRAEVRSVQIDPMAKAA